MWLAGSLRGVDFSAVPDGPPPEVGQDNPAPGPTADADASPVPAAGPLSKWQGKPAYKPWGSIEKAFYDKSELFGVCGPAGTGKSRGLLEKVHLLCEKYPGCRGLIVRKTRASMSQSVLYTFEVEVVPASHAIVKDGNKRSHRQSYLYPSGSELVVAGLDDPQKIMSAQYDFVYIQEATELDEEDVEMLSTRCRNGVMPYQQIMFDCNPSFPLHWINQSALADKFPLYPSYHEDNPTLWQQAPAGTAAQSEGWPDKAPDGRVGKWTEKGKKYISRLMKTTGARLQRLYYGKWAAAEGAVYDAWNPDVHVVDKRPLPKEWRRIWGVDFGFTHPFVFHSWAVDPDGRMWLEAEIYMTQRLVSAHCEDILELTGWRRDEEGGYVPTREEFIPLPEALVCDHDAEGGATMDQHLGLRRINAFKPIADGIQAVSNRMAVQADGLPRVLFMRDTLLKEDPDLAEAHLPTRTVQEPDSYVWDESKGKGRKEVPVDEHNHGMDVTRYCVSYADRLVEKIKAKDVAMASVPSQTIAAIRRSMGTTEGGGVGWTSFGSAGRRSSRTGRISRRRLSRI